MAKRSALRTLSPMEETLFAAIRKQRLTSSELVKAAYKGRKKPFTANKSVLTVARSLQRKRKKVRSSKRAGPFPIEFWIE